MIKISKIFLIPENIPSGNLDGRDSSGSKVDGLLYIITRRLPIVSSEFLIKITVIGVSKC